MDADNLHLTIDFVSSSGVKCGAKISITIFFTYIEESTEIPKVAVLG